jgi:hypothetical protein
MSTGGQTLDGVFNRRRLAFDPGKKGGWALLVGTSLIEWGRLPVTKTKPPAYDYRAIRQIILDARPDVCIIEKVNAHASPQASAIFSLGGCFEMLKCIATLCDVAVEFAPPGGKTGWPQIMVSGKKKSCKVAHMEDAARLFPCCYQDMQIKANEGAADSILMAEWSRRRNL